MTTSAKWFLGILLVLAVVTVGISILLIGLRSGSRDRTDLVISGSGDKVAIVELNGIIVESGEIVRQLKKFRDDKSIRAIVLRIDSPGGGVVASQEIYEEAKKTRDAGKPIVASMGSLAASGGYYVACGCSRLVANQGTLTGSIGVISEFLQVEEALAKLGIAVKTVKSGKLKDAGSMVRKMTEEDQRYFQDLMDDVHHQFIAVVEQERKLDHEEVLALADGRVFTGQQAQELGLVDTLGTYQDAIAIAAQLAGISGEPTIVKERKYRSWWSSMFGDVSESLTSLKDEIMNRPVLSYRFVGP